MGTFVSATIAGSEAENIIRVPRSVVRGSDELVFVDDESKLRIRKVNIIRGDANFVYLGGGADVGERVVVTSLETPINGMAVRVKGDPPPVNDKLVSSTEDN